MMLKTLSVLFFVAVVSALPVDDIKAPVEEDKGSALAHRPAGPGLVAAPGPVLGAAPGPVLGAAPGPALGPALVLHKNPPKGESDLKTDATQWSYYRYNNGYYNGPSVYSYNTPSYYSYWNSYW